MSKQRLDELNKKSVLKQEIYIVEGIGFDWFRQSPKSGFNDSVYYFKNLRTILNEPLPAFKKPPVLVATSSSGATMALTHVTTESFTLYSSLGAAGDSTLVRVNLLITALPEEKPQ